MAEEEDENIQQSVFSKANKKHNRNTFMDDEANNSGSDGNDDDEDGDSHSAYADIEVAQTNNSKTQRRQSLLSSSPPKTSGSKRKKGKDDDDDNNDHDENDLNFDPVFYDRTMDGLACDFFNDTEVTEIILSNAQKVNVPKEYNVTVADITHPNLIMLSNSWVRDNIDAPVPKAKKKTKDEKQECELLLKAATEEDISRHLNLDSGSTSTELTETLKMRLMRTHFKFAFFLHVGQLLETPADICRYFTANSAADMFKCHKKGMQ
jgi:hypothetical protein